MSLWLPQEVEGSFLTPMMARHVVRVYVVIIRLIEGGIAESRLGVHFDKEVVPCTPNIFAMLLM